jgi:hypothetical protein
MFSILWEVKTPPTSTTVGGEPAGDPFPQLPPPGVARAVRLAIAGNGGQIETHQTDTIDVVAVVSGRVDLVLETGTVSLSAGEYLVMQGDIHGWSNPHAEACVIFGLMLGAPRA